jgi:hypothetical protein
VHFVVSPYKLSLSTDRLAFSSAPLVFLTSTLYLTVAQAAWVPTTPLVTVAVVGTSVDVTETLLDEPLKVRLVLRLAWPFTATVSVTVVSSTWGPAVKVHVAVVAPVAGIFSAPQVVPELPQ